MTVQLQTSQIIMYRLLLMIAVVSISLFCGNTVYARPGNAEEYGRFAKHDDKCKMNDMTVIETCQRCAKQTKSSIVYPLCCTNEDDAYNWCDRYITYGREAK